ncbi:MAG: hypothetical protein A3H31_10495 [Gallionellales bacterium RIFCSPLOWO2_02_FULL_57_47]|nr:MAG: hypothetical protein A3H31_10495 [Gallionellales bacterium RIFCSPLOWO2_02_FULL_57_47]
MQIKYISPSSANPPGLFRKTVALITMVALAGVALLFSAMLLVVILIVVVFGGAYLWWKTRELRKQMKNFAPSPHSATVQSDVFAGEAFKGEVMEGEVVRMDEARAVGRR